MEGMGMPQQWQEVLQTVYTNYLKDIAQVDVAIVFRILENTGTIHRKAMCEEVIKEIMLNYRKRPFGWCPTLVSESYRWNSPLTMSSALYRETIRGFIRTDALKDVQLKNQTLQEQNRRLLTAPTVLPDAARSSPPPQDTSSATSSANDSASTTDKNLFIDKDSQKAVEYCAMKMVIFGHVWWDRKGLFGAGLDLETAHHELDATTLTNSLDTSVQRPSKDRVAVLRLILKLYEFLPEVFRPLVNATIKSDYLKLYKMDNGVPSGHFQGNFDRNEDLLCRELLGYESPKVYDRHPPCLFANGYKTGATMFRTMSGVKILICLLWGNTALDNQQITTKGTNSELWHVTEVNAAAIAFAAIVTRYLLSGDPEFKPVGSKSGINYMADFEYYVERIEDQLKKGTKSMHNTLKFYNDHVFPPTQNHRSRAVTTVPVSLTEQEENFWAEIEALDKSKDSDDTDFDSADQTVTAPADSDALSAFSIEPTLSVSPLRNIPSATSESIHAQIPLLQPASTMSETVHLETADNSDRVRSKGKGRKGRQPAMPRVTRVTRSRGGQAKVGAEAPIPSAMKKRKGERTPQWKVSVLAAQEAVQIATDTAPNRTFFGDNVDDDEYDSEEEEEEEGEEEV
ncbi:hypothetical protein IW261DRAFT_1424287 [Armillaria novae-zelandiae]|uniref:Uncharacterized protein n=1 Tax=Armillaria novae-zelandiae TaxID=153914 RepID=A0AA39NVR6_9AGAR|nr:hypothetical protein IW261DRAFT_1424287 [Armillaria novae-zelandiae]